MSDTRLIRARQALEGLSVGDAFGEQFFGRQDALARLAPRESADLADYRAIEAALPAMWHWTDDTAMAISVVETLRDCGQIDRDDLARRFAEAYLADNRRGYGPAMHRLLPQLRQRGAWQTAPLTLFSGQGSLGNGAAMRVAPVGAYYADDTETVVEQARRSAEVTHAHAEGIAGAIAVAVATAYAWRLRGAPLPAPRDFLAHILTVIPRSEVADKIRRACGFRAGLDAPSAAAMLGNGSEVTAQDTVPFVLWSAAHHLSNYAEALWYTVRGLGDMDTTCAMVGGIVVMYTGLESIPHEWRQRHESINT